jgi:serine/threonine protein kinase
VYDYMPRGSLEEALHGHGGEVQAPGGKGGGGVALGWPERCKVAAGVARALEYLHGDGGVGHRRPMIHRDVKSSNILVAADFEPKVRRGTRVHFRTFRVSAAANVLLRVL